MTDKPTMKEILFTADGIKDQPIGEANYSQREVDTLIQAANEAALREAASKVPHISAPNLDPTICAGSPPYNMPCPRCDVLALILEPSALAQHDEKLKAEFAAVMDKIPEEYEFVTGQSAEWIRTLIPTDYASTLDRRLAEARLEEAEWIRDHTGASSGYHSRYLDLHIAELRRAVKGEAKQ